MAKKVGLNVYVDPAIIRRLRETATHYDGRLGECISAGILMFLEATPQEQASALQRLYAASLRASVESLIAEIRAEQARRTLGKGTKHKDD